MRGGTDVPFLVAQRDKLCLGNSYTTTLHIISSSIVKLGKLTRAEKVFRGIAGGVLPDEFWTPNALNVRGGVEYAFMSTTRDEAVAMAYARGQGSARGGLVFELTQGLIDRGASLGWLSQYPFEDEILFAPLTGIEVRATRVRGSVLVIEAAPAINLASLTIEQVVGKRRGLVRSMAKGIEAELSFELQVRPPTPTPSTPLFRPPHLPAHRTASHAARAALRPPCGGGARLLVCVRPSLPPVPARVV
jgi:hypothetical protein